MDTGTSLPIIIGITGHRDIPAEDMPRLTEVTYTLLLQIKEQHLSAPITVLSSLSEGADQLCARAALDVGLRLSVPLPMIADEYRKDFSEDAASEFDRLRSLADDVFVVPPFEPVPPRPGRGFYYRQAGLYVAKYAHILIALWDGVKNQTADGAGTYETIKLGLGACNNSAVWQIVTPRKNTEMPENVFSVTQYR